MRYQRLIRRIQRMQDEYDFEVINGNQMSRTIANEPAPRQQVLGLP